MEITNCEAPDSVIFLGPNILLRSCLDK